jgi:hypothetical protein
MALGSAQPLTAMSTRNLPVGKGLPVFVAVSQASRTCGSLNEPQTYEPPGTVTGIVLLSPFFFSYSGGVESKLGPLGTAAIYCPIVPAPGDL